MGIAMDMALSMRGTITAMNLCTGKKVIDMSKHSYNYSQDWEGYYFVRGPQCPDELYFGGEARARSVANFLNELTTPKARPISEYHEDHGSVVWWAWEDDAWLGEPAWIGTPSDSDWPGYHTHWTPHPAMPDNGGA